MKPAFSALAGALVAPLLAGGQTVTRITPAELDGYLRFVSSDMLEGRAPAMPGGRIAAESIASQLRSWGVGPGASGYNGALDKASGVADMLAVARVAAQSRRPRRSQLFVGVTAEESLLLGSSFFAQNPTVPVQQIVANLNVDGGSLPGRTRDLTVLGEQP